MSKNIVIQEGGAGKQLTVDKLKTNLVNGGPCTWVPEDEVQLTTKTITKNGTYKASDDGYYGYSEVTVSGIGSVTGTDPTTGEDTTVTTGPTGELETTVLPHSIKVETPPTVTTYADGATIDFSGMVVKAYLKSGNVWTDSSHPNGVIPINELILPITTADAEDAHADEWSDGDGVNATHIVYAEHWQVDSKGRDYVIYISRVVGSRDDSPVYLGGNSMASILVTRYNGRLYTKRLLGDDDFSLYKESNGHILFNGSTSYKTKTTWSSTTVWTNYITDIAESTKAPDDTRDLQPVSAYQSIPVQWMRPGDYSTLESSFNITVT